MRSFILLATFAGLLLCGCATSRPFAMRSADEVRTGVCEQRSPEVFAITGEIDAALASCVRAEFAETTSVLVLDTMGGNVEAALDIAELIAGRQLTMRVEGECNSSCANYFLPLARRIEMAPNAMVLLHGGVDPWTIDLWRSRRAEFEAMRMGQADDGSDDGFARFADLAERTAARQAAFADRHDVSPGWLLYRTPGSRNVAGLSRTPSGSLALLVEERMMRSCLPSVEIAPYQTSLERRWLRSYRRIGLMWSRITPSGDVTCI